MHHVKIIIMLKEKRDKIGDVNTDGQQIFIIILENMEKKNCI